MKFTYYNPTKIYFGSQLDKLGSVVKEYGDRVLVMYGGSSAKKHGVYNTVMESLKAAGLTVSEFSGVEKLPPEIEFITWYHAAASIDTVLRWIFSDEPESPELMATRITNVRRLSMSSMLFGLDSRIYDITDSYDYQAYEPDFHSRLMNDPE